MLPFAQENEWEDLCNLVVENGCLRTRNPRGTAQAVYTVGADGSTVVDRLVIASAGDADDMCALHDGYALITRVGCLIVNGKIIHNFEDRPKRSIVPFGRTFILLPDGIWYKPDENGNWSGTQGENFPTVDFAIAHGNRLWACRYGTNVKGDFVNEIYVSALGEPLNFNKYDGIASDSFTVSIATPGAFTGVGATADAVVFFKNDSVSVVYGQMPEEYTVQSYSCEGVQAGCAKSVTTINGAIYYKSSRGVYVWSGYEPFCVSEQIVGRYKNARACAAGDLYYIAMDNEQGETQLFVLDTSNGIWTREDVPVLSSADEHDDFVLLLMAFNNSVYLVQSLSVGLEEPFLPLLSVFGMLVYDIEATDKIELMLNGTYENGTNIPLPEDAKYAECCFVREDPVSYSARSTQIGLLTPDHKRVLSVQVRADIAKDGRLKVSAIYDDGACDQVYDSAGRAMQDTACIRFVPRRCDRMRLLLEGTGDVTVYSITKTVEHASEVSKRA